MAFPTAYHADSDADDEYERTEMTSPILPTDDDTSPTDSDPPSTEPTPTFGRSDTEKLSPGNAILQWTAEQCVDYVASLGLPQYCDRFLENEIVGEALIALKHDDLKEMGIISMGHRLTILKDIYDVKVKQEIPFDPDHYVPPSAEASTNDRTATQDDISRLIQSMRLRDERLIHTENELRRITEEHRKLRDELLPIFRMAKDRSQPLPFHPPSASPDLPNYDDAMSQAQPEKGGSSLSRKFSTKRLFLGSTPKNNSPTHMPQSIPEGKAMTDNANLDPSAAVTAAQSHLTASMTGGSQPATSPNQANIPSPTSPNTYANQPTLHSRTFRDVIPNTARYNPHPDDQSQYTTILPSNPDRSNPTPTPGSSSRSTRGFRNDPQDDPPPSGGSSRDREPPSVEIFKSFRVSMEDPCHKVLPAALKKYNINADWRQYALYIVYGDQERCLGLEEKPLILFKQLDREGKKPMFMLRRHAAPIEGHSGPTSGGFEMPVVGGGRAGGSSLQLPGGTDKLYITHSEWASEDTYSASAGSGTRSAKPDGSFKRLPYNFCAISLQPFTHPVCTIDGTIFDITNILPWLKKHGTNPVTAKPLRSDELIKLHFHQNDEGEMVDPVTFKVFTDNTHIVALKVSGNVFAYDTVERLNIKAKMWRDLVSDEEFTRKDVITIQDPQNIEARNLSSFKYLQDGISTLTEEQRRERDDPSRNVNKKALGNAAAVLKTKESSQDPEKRVGKYLPQNNASVSTKSLSKSSTTTPTATQTSKPSSIPYNAAQHTTGKAAASFTSTGLTPHTSADRALLSDEDYMLKPRRVKTPGYARLHTSLGDLNLELLPEFAPRAVWNFVKLAQKGYYRDVAFHRAIRNFMVQGGDPTGTGKGGSSVWGKNFQDEFDGPLSHDARGVLSMANKGKNTNSSQFFVLFRPAKHLDRKHTIFGRVVGGMETLSRIENVEVSDGDKRPTQDVLIKDIVVYVDPFAEFQKAKRERDDREREKAEIAKSGGTEDDRTTWTGKRVRADGKAENDANGGGAVVGKYLSGVQVGGGGEVVVEEWEGAEGPARKKGKMGGFGNFDAW